MGARPGALIAFDRQDRPVNVGLAGRANLSGHYARESRSVSSRSLSGRGGGVPAPAHWPSPICFMNAPLSQNRYSSNMMPCLFQWPIVAIGIL
jgi:hypothetical protein